MVSPARPRPRFDLSRAAFYLVSTCAVLGLTFALGVRAGARKTAAYFFWADLFQSIVDSVDLTASEAPTIAGLRPTHFLQPSRYPGSGVTVNDASSDQTDLILLAGFFDDSNELRLIRRNGEIVAKWPVKYHELFPNPDFIRPAKVPTTDWNTETHGALALPDGSVVFNFEYGGLAKLDACNRVVWTLGRQTHHSVELAEDGGFWVPGRRWVEGTSPFPPFEAPFDEDTVLHVSADGRVLSEFSTVGLMYENGLKPLLTATGSFFTAGMSWDREIVHLNKIAELPRGMASAFPTFEPGDLLLSFRVHNLLMVADANGSRVKWWQVGPWLRQHDPHFLPDGRILLFNNNIFWTVMGSGEAMPLETPAVSQVMSVDPATGDSRVEYGGVPQQEMVSVVQGKVEPLPGGHVLITEPDGGRVREIDATRRVVWEYVNRYSADELAEITQARLYPASYFTVDFGDRLCR